MNSKLFLTYDFKKIIFQKNNKINEKSKFIYSKNPSKLISYNNIYTIQYFKWYISRKINNNFPFLMFYLVFLLGNKAGNYLAQKIIINNSDNIF